MDKNKGFTLVELLVVMTIMGILLAILVPSVSRYKNSAEEKTLKSDAKLVYSSIRTTISDNPKFLKNFDETDEDLKKNIITDISEYANTYVIAPYMQLIVSDGSELDKVVVDTYGQWQIMDIKGVKGHGIEATIEIKTITKDGVIIDFVMNKNGIEQK